MFFFIIRDYDVESERQKQVEEFYMMNHIHQTYDFVSMMMIFSSFYFLFLFVDEW